MIVLIISILILLLLNSKLVVKNNFTNILPYLNSKYIVYKTSPYKKFIWKLQYNNYKINSKVL